MDMFSGTCWGAAPKYHVFVRWYLLRMVILVTVRLVVVLLVMVILVMVILVSIKRDVEAPFLWVAIAAATRVHECLEKSQPTKTDRGTRPITVRGDCHYSWDSFRRLSQPTPIAAQGRSRYALVFRYTLGRPRRTAMHGMQMDMLPVLANAYPYHHRHGQDIFDGPRMRHSWPDGGIFNVHLAPLLRE